MRDENMTYRRAVLLLSLLIAVLAAFAFLYALVEALRLDWPPSAMSFLAEGLALLAALFYLIRERPPLKEMGLRFAGGSCIKALLVSAAATALLVLIKLLAVWIAPQSALAAGPFFRWSRFLPGGISLAHALYPLTSVLQEFLARTVMQESLSRIFAGKRAQVAAIVLSSLVFGALHLAYGLPFMLATSLYMGVLGAYYAKNRNLWGMAIIHFVLGEAFKTLFA